METRSKRRATCITFVFNGKAREVEMCSIGHIKYCARLPVGFTLSPPTESCAEPDRLLPEGVSGENFRHGRNLGVGSAVTS